MTAPRLTAPRLAGAKAFARGKAFDAVPLWVDPVTANRFACNAVEVALEEGVAPESEALAAAAVALVKKKCETHLETLRFEAERRINRAYLAGDLL